MIWTLTRKNYWKNCCAITLARCFGVARPRILDNVITQSIVFDGSGSLKEYVGGYQDYVDAKQREDKIQAAVLPKNQTENQEIKEKPKANRTVKLSYKEQRELDALPDEIAALEAEQAALAEQLSNPDIFKDYEKSWQPAKSCRRN